MLVLTRRVGERIAIDSAIRVTVLAIKGDTVRLGVAAPAHVLVDRWEVHERRRREVPGGPALSVSWIIATGETMQTAQLGDRVRVHYVKRLQDGSVASSRDRAPLELTVGTEDPRLPGLGLALVGLAPGTRTTVRVPPEQAYGAPDPTRVHRWARTRFPADQPLVVGRWVRVQNAEGRLRSVRILEVRAGLVVVDTNHRAAGQAMELEVELVGIQAPSAGSELRGP
jgi:carbon storage regulator CsrA